MRGCVHSNVDADVLMQAANLDAVHQSMTLLKNVNNALPLNVQSVQSIAIIGPNGFGNAEKIVIITDAFEKATMLLDS